MTDRYVAFNDAVRLAQGGLADVALAVRRLTLREPQARVLVFDRQTGGPVDLDLRGDDAAIEARYAAPDEPARGRGRPKLGVVAREVTLLPRHWDWLAQQPGGASTTLRRLVEAARKADDGATQARLRTEAAYRFMSAMAGNRLHFEDASRALFAGDTRGFAGAMKSWPADIRDEVLALLSGGEGLATNP